MTYAHRFTFRPRYFLTNFFTKGWGIATGCFLVTMIASPTEAATFRVEYTGTVSNILNFQACTSASCIGRSRGTYTTLESLSIRNGNTVSLSDRIIGSYTFDDQSNTVTANRFRFVQPDAVDSLDPAVPAATDVTFTEAVGNTTTAAFSSARMPGFDQAIFDSLPLNEQSQYQARFGSQSESLTLNQAIFIPDLEDDNIPPGNLFPNVLNPFLYQEVTGAPPAPGFSLSTTSTFGSLDQFRVIAVSSPTTLPTTPPTSPISPTTIPEPTVLLGLLLFSLFSGLGLSSRPQQGHY